MNSLRLRFSTTDDDVILSRSDRRSAAAAGAWLDCDWDETSFITFSCCTLIGSPDDDVTIHVSKQLIKARVYDRNKTFDL